MTELDLAFGRAMGALDELRAALMWPGPHTEDLCAEDAFLALWLRIGGHLPLLENRP